MQIHKHELFGKENSRNKRKKQEGRGQRRSVFFVYYFGFVVDFSTISRNNNNTRCFVGFFSLVLFELSWKIQTKERTEMY